MKENKIRTVVGEAGTSRIYVVPSLPLQLTQRQLWGTLGLLGKKTQNY